jgi:hypothetical protein
VDERTGKPPTLIHATPALLDGWCGPGVDDKGGGLIIDGESQTVHDLAGRGYDYQWYGDVALIRLGWDDVSPILLDLARPEVQDRVCRVLCARGAMTTEPSGNPRQLPAWFRWMPGMLAVDEHGRRWRVDAGPQDDWCGSYRPVLTDPATLGCLVGLLREVSGDPEAHVEPTDRGWAAWYGSADSPVYGRIYGRTDAPTEGAALWAALDAAWAMRGGA